MDAQHPRPAWGSIAGTIERRGTGTRVSTWMATHGYALQAGGPPVVWPWLCPKPVIVQRFTGSREAALCKFLAEGDVAGPERLPCSTAALKEDICRRLSRPSDVEFHAAIGCF